MLKSEEAARILKAVEALGDKEFHDYLTFFKTPDQLSDKRRGEIREHIGILVMRSPDLAQRIAEEHSKITENNGKDIGTFLQNPNSVVSGERAELADEVVNMIIRSTLLRNKMNSGLREFYAKTAYRNRRYRRRNSHGYHRQYI